MFQSIVNFGIFLAVFTAHELWNQKRLQQGKAWFLVTEVRGYKLFALGVAALSCGLDLWLNQVNFMSYLVIFGLIFYMKREISVDYIRIGFGRYKYAGMTKVELQDHENGKSLIVWYGDKSARGVIRTGLTQGLEAAVKKANDHIKALEKGL